MLFGRIRCASCPNPLGGIAACEVVGDPHVIFVGEAPGRTEARTGRPFSGRSGKLLRDAIASADVDVRVGFVNVVSCQPPRNKISSELVESCRGLFEARIETLGRHPLYVALGATAARAFGLKGKMSDLVDTVHSTPYGEVYVLYHPAYILRRGGNRTYVESVRRALKYALTRNTNEIICREVLEPNYDIASSRDEVRQFIDSSDIIAVDIETRGNNPFDPNDSDITVVALYSPTVGKALIVPHEIAYAVREYFGAIVVRGRTVFHNAKFDIRYLRGKGFFSWSDVFSNAENVEDTMLMHYVLYEDGVEYGSSGRKMEKGSHSLKAIVARHLGVLYSFDFEEHSWNKLCEYAARDVIATWTLFDRFSKVMDVYDRKLYAMLKRASMMLAAAEETGVAVDWEELERLRKKYVTVADMATAKMRRVIRDSSLNPRSVVQVRRVLYETFGINPVKTTQSGAPSTDAESIAHIADNVDDAGVQEFIGALLEFRTADKLLSTYIRGFQKRAWRDGRIHPSFHLTGTVTGRLSSSNPNMQNVSKHSLVGKELRGAFVAPEGHVIVSVDGSQMELRVFSWLANDEAYAGPIRRGEDIHSATARAIYGATFDSATPEERKMMRTRAKRVSFGVLYGIGPEGLAKQINASVDEAKAILDAYYEAHPAVLEYRTRRIAELLANGQVITPATGRKRRIQHLPPTGSKDWEDLQKHIWNAEVQGLASDINLTVATRLNERWYGRGVRIFALIHDSIEAYAPEEIAVEYAEDAVAEFTRVGEEMTGGYIPFVGEAELGYNWATLKPLEEWKNAQEEEAATTA